MNYDTLNFYEYYDTCDVDCADYVCSNGVLEEHISYQSMWKAVILQAIIDSTSNYRRMENKLEKIKATNWLNDFSRDFITVCHFAGYNPLSVRNKAKRIISDNKILNEDKIRG
ncbi:hypothetical protein ECHHL_0332 [Ehrlichia chaffeensis str. Heartland]|uniref:Uncharacterized protein n=1 Tax=Ehrlichia chaffeensis (strain ATCC CRL-10679 / Arkansas) TaxID=205920 RepID=Q2GH72_EHRCR|nr:hypothetical protein [Ehrlichia chaffeensis]ABD44601.1 conserved hypothetical protein [Ehrlichia chaffeensis str. Arkansas]AHX03497.1 hypothetical protein ECHHL_0332 [Ehrlichia chaffeensis str. Heartland]AHX05782.1 hypothetical protein ECHJAX_0725 [Ehrlichia chaffeensis str. Jax]AHX06774.1 hypothetical protein ECHLIB_0729 [Ehrlichia chaffeensis str. Liberty]AHX07704.1 hypothetical protein ECHOSC_0340 [Ehrlichia chaffeensis str. Osceola]